VARRRSIEVFTLSFLDCICCGFGAVILFYTIVSAQSGVVRLKETDTLSSEVNRLKQQVLTGERSLVVLRDTLQKTRNETASATRETNRIVTDLASRREQVSSYDAQTLARREHIEKLKADIRSLEQSNKRLEAGSLERAPLGQEVSGRAAAERRYITGLTLLGKRQGVRRYVNCAERVRLFDEALSQLPEQVPVDCVLLPMEGDLQAAHRFWRLARLTDGTLLMPAKDWP